MRLLSLLLIVCLFTACDSNDDPYISITEGAAVTITNTFQSAAAPPTGTGGVETAIEDFRGVPSGSLAADTTVTFSGSEVASFLDIYDIDITEETIRFVSVADTMNPPSAGFFRVLETGTFDRYYFSFGETINATSVSTDSDFVNASLTSDSELLVEIGEGYDTSGSGFIIVFDE